jgi:hypothetical protein
MRGRYRRNFKIRELKRKNQARTTGRLFSSFLAAKYDSVLAAGLELNMCVCSINGHGNKMDNICSNDRLFFSQV